MAPGDWPILALATVPPFANINFLASSILIPKSSANSPASIAKLPAVPKPGNTPATPHANSRKAFEYSPLDNLSIANPDPANKEMRGIFLIRLFAILFWTTSSAVAAAAFVVAAVVLTTSKAPSPVPRR